ncbi:uncharacterized protein LOC131596090 [Vicia villosa]|uniref:uncharacterized protein LOC131596090 n=1 Tax=Vicia villosa TaxID=3911 RepID=UPI00273A9C7C|nr:uncharacterized protein LOC131596090 [Vicia villosa]
MKPALVKSNPVNSRMRENLQSPNLDDKRIRSERRWRRREIMVDSLRDSRVASATKKASKISRSTDILVDKNDHRRDEDWETFMATYTDDNDEEMDEDYRSFWATFNSDIEAGCASNLGGGSNIGSDETDEEFLSFLDTYEPDVENDSVGNQSGGSNVDGKFDNNNVSEEIREGDNCFSNQFVSDYISNGVEVDEDDQSLRRTFSVGQNSLISEQEFDTPEVQCVVDEDYEQFLNSGTVVDGDFVYDCDKNTKNTSNIEDENNSSDSDLIVLDNPGLAVDGDFVHDCDKDTKNTSNIEDENNSSDSDLIVLDNPGLAVDGDFVHDCDKDTKNTSNVEDESNSSDSDLIVLESYPNCENTPFVSSKAYDPSYFGEEMHPKDNMQTTSFHHSQFRKRLLEYLDRPYDHEEYKSLLVQAYERKEKERHLETRRGVIKSYHTVGVSKSYLQVHPDLAKAIAMESKEKPRVLFLLRGLFFWLENLSHEGQFQPWRDEACLEIMRKM